MASDQPARVNTQLESAIKALLFDQPIAYHPAIATAVGSVTAGVLLSQFLYWTPRSTDPDGWIWKTQDQIHGETGLTRKEQESARRYLRDAGVLAERKAGVPAKLFFRVDIERLTALLAASKDAQNGQTGMPKTGRLGCPKGAPKRAHSGQRISEITTEITPESTSREPSLLRRDGNPSKIRKGKPNTSEQAAYEVPTAPIPEAHSLSPGFTSLGTLLRSGTSAQQKTARKNPLLPEREGGDERPATPSRQRKFAAQMPLEGPEMGRGVPPQGTGQTGAYFRATDGQGGHSHDAQDPRDTPNEKVLPRPRRRASYSPERQRILAYLEDFAQELNDTAPLASSVTRAYNLWQQSGVDLDTFTQAMLQARAVTKERTAGITSQDPGRPGTYRPKRKMAYWFEVLADVLGLKEHPEERRAPTTSERPPRTVQRRQRPAADPETPPVRSLAGKYWRQVRH